jgi:hypothetical protein
MQGKQASRSGIYEINEHRRRRSLTSRTKLFTKRGIHDKKISLQRVQIFITGLHLTMLMEYITTKGADKHENL